MSRATRIVVFLLGALAALQTCVAVDVPDYKCLSRALGKPVLHSGWIDILDTMSLRIVPDIVAPNCVANPDEIDAWAKANRVKVLQTPEWAYIKREDEPFEHKSIAALRVSIDVDQWSGLDPDLGPSELHSVVETILPEVSTTGAIYDGGEITIKISAFPDRSKDGDQESSRFVAVVYGAPDVEHRVSAVELTDKGARLLWSTPLLVYSRAPRIEYSDINHDGKDEILVAGEAATGSGHTQQLVVLARDTGREMTRTPDACNRMYPRRAEHGELNLILCPLVGSYIQLREHDSKPTDILVDDWRGRTVFRLVGGSYRSIPKHRTRKKR